MPTSLVSVVLSEDDPDIVVGRALIESWAGKKLSDPEEYRLARKRFYAAANARQAPVTKIAGIGWVGRKSLIAQHRRGLIERIDREGRERVGLPPAA